MDINKVLAFIWVVVLEPLINRMANYLWDDLWAQIILAVNDAEEKWAKSGRGEKKKAEVCAAILKVITDRAQLSWIQLMLAKLFVSKVVDAIIDEANVKAGKDWAERVAEARAILANKLPVIEDEPVPPNDAADESTPA
ncbi:MAG: hypothetical protein WC340_18545 [Kiritimatiellia bacterium]